MGNRRINASAATRDGPVDPFGGQQQRATDAMRFAKFQKWALNCNNVIKAGEMIKSGDCIHVRQIRPLDDAFKSVRSKYEVTLLRRWPIRRRRQ